MTRYRLATIDEGDEVYLEALTRDGCVVFCDDEQALELTWSQAAALLWYLQAGDAIYATKVAQD